MQSSDFEMSLMNDAFQFGPGVIVTSLDRSIIRVNQAGMQIFDKESDQLIGSDLEKIISQSFSLLDTFGFWQVLDQADQSEIELQLQSRNRASVYYRLVTIKIEAKSESEGYYLSWFYDISSLKTAEKEVEKLAFYDPLTALPNRRLFHDRLEHELNIARRYHRAGILFFLDLDHFKQINDAFGHSVGDELLIETSKRLKSLLRDTDTAVRIGGDEFIILASAQDGMYTDVMEQSRIIAEKIIIAINSPFLIREHELFISTSIGITLFTGDDETVESLLARTDTAMYQAKQDGRNTFCYYQQSMQDALDKKSKIENALKRAVNNREFSLHYQPQITDHGSLKGVEALLRWHNASLGTMAPEEFIDIAEQANLTHSIGYWVFSAVCSQIRTWDRQQIDIPYVAINISPKQFLHADFVSICVHLTFEYQIEPERLMFEITENVFLDNMEEVADKMRSLKKHGFRFSLDDFGTGFSSITFLKKLPFDQLKLEQNYSQEKKDQQNFESISKAIIIMANGMGLEVVAEGVETDSHFAFLSAYGCHNYQGFFFSKPLTADLLEDYIQGLNESI